MSEQSEAWTTRLHVRMHCCRGEERPWEMRPSQRCPQVFLSVKNEQGAEIVRAHFTGYADHPRALLCLLEGLALWQGEPLDVVISADAAISSSLGLGAFGGEWWPAQSALVRFRCKSGEDQHRCEQGIDRCFPPWPDNARSARGEG